MTMTVIDTVSIMVNGVMHQLNDKNDTIMGNLSLLSYYSLIYVSDDNGITVVICSYPLTVFSHKNGMIVA